MAKTTKTPKQAEEFEPAGELKLRKPLLLDGKSVTALQYNFDELTAQDLIEADKDRSEENVGSIVYLQTMDTTSLLCLFARAVGYRMKNCEMSDIKRLSALDAQAAIVLARRFFSQGKDAEESEAETSTDEL